MKYLGSSFTVALGGDAYREGYDRIDWRKDKPRCERCSDTGVILTVTVLGSMPPEGTFPLRQRPCPNCGTRPQSHDTPDFSSGR